ncbi:putative motility protein [Modicisalibacter tunisiensis]|uniref:Motility protein n=1 Tax=Modicisalibacter tunisiensis TaxID=390637 RepID=A0ABS7X3T2_9GAMM|nr:putative motility protein [Modicisalibacter tunisiensis]MBZ9537499.1 putative motility protein [Modicisalibacter tunisiensis]MBZ9569079.1 putative motility protein [Modicisalibacter tunisiensis]
MDSISAMSGMASALQQYNAGQQTQMSLLKESLDTQSAHVSQLMESVAPQQDSQLATSGSVGTQINTYA